MAPNREELDTQIEAGKHLVFREILSQAPDGCIAEVGTMRFPHVTIDGRSTLFWAQNTDRVVYSLEINPEYIEVCRHVLESHDLAYRVNIIEGDAKDPAIWPEASIGLLYLDNGDNPLGTFQAYLAAYPHLVDGAIVLIDDCQPWSDQHIPQSWSQPMPEGKGTILLPYIREQGIEVTMHQPPEPGPMSLASFKVSK